MNKKLDSIYRTHSYISDMSGVMYDLCLKAAEMLSARMVTEGKKISH